MIYSWFSLIRGFPGGGSILLPAELSQIVVYRMVGPAVPTDSFVAGTYIQMIYEFQLVMKNISKGYMCQIKSPPQSDDKNYELDPVRLLKRLGSLK